MIPFSHRRPFPVLLVLLLAMVLVVACSDNGPGTGTGERLTTESKATRADDAGTAARRERLGRVESWFYFLSVDPAADTFDRLADSSYDMAVIEPIFTEAGNQDFDIAAVVEKLHAAAEPKLVIAYIDIGQAEEWRTYWQRGWRVGNPEWIVAADPDGWEGNFPVAYWRDEWQAIWLADNGYLQQLIDAGFDGVYLDWVEAYSDENVMAAAEGDDVYATAEMIRWVGRIAAYGRQRDPDFIVIAQNAAELATDEDYRGFIDAIAQEQVWFDGGADNQPPGDCPLPRTEAEVGTEAYAASLSPACRETYDRYPDSTLHVSSEEYISALQAARGEGLTIFTVDYATEPENVSWIYRISRESGFVPFVSERDLATWREPVS